MKHINLILILFYLLIMQISCKRPYPIESVIAMTEVFGEGQKIIAMIVEYDTEIKNSSLSIDNFFVEGREITKVYANIMPEKSQEGTDGRYVVIELSTHDSVVPHRRTAVLRNTRISVKQTGTISTVIGRKYGAWDQPLQSNRDINLIVDDFIQGKYRDPAIDEVLSYNLFVPQNYDPGEIYPLILFIHDKGAISIDVKTTLEQGLGAVIWATPSEQEKHACFVLAPQYNALILNADSETTDYLDITVHLIEELIQKYSIDTNRLYTTGQAEGCILSIAIDNKYPDLFAASFLVASQWDSTKIAPLANKKLWIVVSEGDEKAYSSMEALTDTLKKEGAKVSKTFWNGTSTNDEFEREVKKMISQKSNINYTILKKGTIIPKGMKDDDTNNHIYTWRIAYRIEGIRDWVFRQEKVEKEEKE